jgi:hypothetical protein
LAVVHLLDTEMRLIPLVVLVVLVAEVLLLIVVRIQVLRVQVLLVKVMPGGLAAIPLIIAAAVAAEQEQQVQVRLGNKMLVLAESEFNGLMGHTTRAAAAAADTMAVVLRFKLLVVMAAAELEVLAQINQLPLVLRIKAAAVAAAVMEITPLLVRNKRAAQVVLELSSCAILAGNVALVVLLLQLMVIPTIHSHHPEHLRLKEKKKCRILQKL